MTRAAVFLFICFALAGEVGAANLDLPGAPTIVPISIPPRALGYDLNPLAKDGVETKLYGITSYFGHPCDFVSINANTGTFTTIQALPFSYSSCTFESNVLAGIDFSPISSNTKEHIIYIHRQDGIIGVDTVSGSITPYPLPSDQIWDLDVNPISHYTFGVSENGLDSLNFQTGEARLSINYQLNFSCCSGSAIDPFHHIFYVAEPASTQNPEYLDAIDESSGTDTRTQLNVELTGLYFDPVGNVLYGITKCCPNTLGTINPTDGTFTFIANVGGNNHQLRVGNSAPIDPDNRYFNVSGGNGPQLVIFDTMANRSWYVQTRGSDFELYEWMYDAGRALGERDYSVPGTRFSMAILDFGQPQYNTAHARYGAFGWGKFTSVETIHKAVIQFAAGYWVGTGGNNSSRVTIVIGVSNDNGAGGVTPQHAEAWRKMVDSVNKELRARGYADQVSAIGGMDIEPDYSTPVEAENWVSSYGTSEFVDFGSADGCPPPTGSQCDNSWTQSDVVKVASAFVIPEIYSSVSKTYPEGHQAEQWGSLDQVAKSQSGHYLTFMAPLGEFAACNQRPSGCKYLDNNPYRAWTELSAVIAGAGPLVCPSYNGNFMLCSTTDIQWRNTK